MKWETEILSPNSSWLMEESKSAVWTAAENKLFENALAKIDKDTPDRWQKVAAMVPGKTVADVRRQYKELEDDVSSIEAGLVPIPGYTVSTFTLEWGNSNGNGYGQGLDGFKGPYKRSSANRPHEQERKKGVPWTEEEHKRFLLGLKKYGKGDWRNISRNLVITRTPTQVASHAQKYFIRQLSGGKDKRRASIHDITTVNDHENSHSPSRDAKRKSPDRSNVLPLDHHPFPAPACRQSLLWNPPNDDALTGFDQMRGAVNPFSGSVYGLKFQGQNIQRGASHEALGAPYLMQSSLHYPHG